MNKTKEVLAFIKLFRDMHPEELCDTFLHGFCYYFAVMLKNRFGGEIYYNPDQVHFATLINGHFFDIRGMITDGSYWYDWKVYQSTNDCSKIVRNCILKYK